MTTPRCRNKIQWPILIWLIGLLIIISSPTHAQANYPKINIDGFKKWEFKDIQMLKNQQNYFAALTQLGGFYPTFTGGPWQERLKLKIIGQLSDQLSVSYDLDQQPETPERYDVKVTYDNSKGTPTDAPGLMLGFNELTFGDFTANFSGNEFASTSKYLNGVMLTAKDSWYDVITVPSAKLKSQTQALTGQNGTNKAGPYNLGHGTIVEGSEKIELNGLPLKRQVDYTIDYFEGKITFTRILAQDDEFKYSYEYTNIIDLFFPTLSKRDFFGFQSRFAIDPDRLGKPEPKEEPIIESVRETFPSSGSSEPEVLEAEASGRYQLKNTPLVNFSERVTFMGTHLTKDEDYMVRYAEGQIKLMTRIMPSEEEPLFVEYRFYKTSWESEAISGFDSRGPYLISQTNIISGTETVEVDGKLVIRDLDYTLDYKLGQIIFNSEISSTSQIKISYQFSQMALPAVAATKFPKQIKVGATYLKEYAKAGDSTATAATIDNISGSTIISNDYHIYLPNRPLTTSESSAISISIAGQILTAEVDYAIPTTRIDAGTGYVIVSPEANLAYINDRTDASDGLDTGTIKILNQNLISATTEVLVSYTYYKSVVGKYNGYSEGTRGPYYLRNTRNIVPGSETVQVWEQGSSVINTYTRNSSFEANAGDLGYSINYDTDNPSITFNSELSSGKTFQIIYQYVAPQGFTGSDIAHSITGFDGSFSIGEALQIETAFAKSETDQVFISETSIESFRGNGSGRYALHSPQEIIEDSEKVYVNNYLLNKDLDYYVSYNRPGQINFYYITPTSQDAIAVEYQYQSMSGVVSGTSLKSDSAYRLGASTKLFGDKLKVSGTTKKIGYDFTPMGGTAIGAGSEYQEYNTNFKPGWHDLALNYSYKQNNNPLTNYRNYYLRNFDNSISLGLNPLSLAQVTYTYRNFRSLDDILPSGSSHNSDTNQDASAVSLIPSPWTRGALAFNQKYDLKRTLAYADILRDSGNYSHTITNYVHTNNKLDFTSRISAAYDFQQSTPRTVSQRSSSIEATALSSAKRSTDNSYNLNVDLTFGRLHKWLARLGRLTHDELTLTKNFVGTNEVLSTRNETFHTDFAPISILNSSFDHNRQERTSVVVDGINPKTERTAGSVKFTPQSWFSAGWNGAQSEVIPVTGLRNKTTGLSHTYTVAYTPLSFSRFQLSSNFSLSDSLQTAPSGTTPEVHTDTDSFSQGYTIKVSPHPAVPVTLGIVLENYQNKNDHPLAASHIDTETQNTTRTVGLSLNPLRPLTLSGNYNEKTIKVVRDLKLTPQERKKRVIDAKAAYQIFSWGTLVYENQYEKNGGEIQAGAVTALNIAKVTQTYSLNITFPMDSPVLTNFVFTATMKNVDYKNLDRPADDFIAARTTFEGTLNF
ncbi:MAG: hypothetical protein ABH823_01985 [bacterium]